MNLKLRFYFTHLLLVYLTGYCSTSHWPNTHWLNLSPPDLSAGLVNVLTDIVWKNTVSWYAGNGGCKVIRYAQVLVTYASTYALVALSLDRLNAIARPLSFSSDRESLLTLPTNIWLSGTMIFIMLASHLESKSKGGKHFKSHTHTYKYIYWEQEEGDWLCKRKEHDCRESWQRIKFRFAKSCKRRCRSKGLTSKGKESRETEQDKPNW